MKKLQLLISILLSVSTWNANAETGYQLDSTITKKSSGQVIEKTIYGRDSSKNITMQANYSWDNKTQQWIGVKKTEYIPNRLNATYNGWDTTSGTWIGYQRFIDKYDNLGNLILRETDTGWDTTNVKWKVSNKEEHQRNSIGFDTLVTISTKSTKSETHFYGINGKDSTIKTDYTLNSTTQSWIISKTAKTINYYNNKGTDTLQITYTLKGSIWINASKIETACDNNGIPISTTNYTWSANKWINRGTKYLTKKESTVDSNGKETLNLVYTWDNVTASWIITSKSEYAFDSKGNQILNANYTWEAATSKLIGTSKEENIWDNDKLTLHTRYNWDVTTSTWVKQGKDEMTYNIPTNSTQTVSSDWNTTTNTWNVTGGSKRETVLDSLNNIIKDINYGWNPLTNTWDIRWGNKRDLTYNANGKIIISVYNSTNPSMKGDTSWVKSKTEFMYDSYGNDTLETPYTWNKNSGTWINQFKYEYAYDSKGNLIKNAGYTDTSSTIKGMIGNYKYEYVFDNNGIKTQQTKFYWDTTNVTWKVDKIINYYSTGIPVIFSVSTKSINIAATECKATVIVTSDIRWITHSNSIWLNTIGGNTGQGNGIELNYIAMANPTTSPRTATITIFGYADVSSDLFHNQNEGISTSPITITVTQAAGKGTPVIEVENDDMLLYPNPTTLHFTVSTETFASVEVYNLNGQMVLCRKVSGKEPISVMGWSKGLYFVKISSGSEVVTKRLIVE